MKKLAKKTKSTIAIIGIIVILAVSAIIAYFTDTVTVTNHAKMGIVDIDLQEYTIDENGNKVQWQDKTDVLPGEIISKIPEISCVQGAVDCYVRAKVVISCEDENLQNSTPMLTLSNLNVNTDDWYYCDADGYFYYKKILTDSSDPAVLFSEVAIPATLNNDWSLENIEIDVTAEAIQSQNFTPNFAKNSSEPWPGITASDIQECIYPNHTK
jgi:hypothetical protein